jgi:hypothetical protein
MSVGVRVVQARSFSLSVDRAERNVDTDFKLVENRSSP